MLQRLIESNTATLNQAVELLGRLSTESYAVPCGELNCSVGSHVRHILDHYTAFLRGVPEGRVDYDARERDERLERDADAALRAVRAAIDGLDAVSNASRSQMGGGLQIKTNTDGDGRDDVVWSTSSVERELQFLLSHTVHHFALIKTVLVRLDIATSDDFGVAPSTLAHRRKGACVR